MFEREIDIAALELDMYSRDETMLKMINSTSRTRADAVGIVLLLLAL